MAARNRRLRRDVRHQSDPDRGVVLLRRRPAPRRGLRRPPGGRTVGHLLLLRSRRAPSVAGHLQHPDAHRGGAGARPSSRVPRLLRRGLPLPRWTRADSVPTRCGTRTAPGRLWTVVSDSRWHSRLAWCCAVRKRNTLDPLPPREDANAAPAVRSPPARTADSRSAVRSSGERRTPDPDPVPQRQSLRLPADPGARVCTSARRRRTSAASIRARATPAARPCRT